MRRRRFFVSTLGAAAGASPLLSQTVAPASGRQYYEIRRYHLISGPQQKAASAYFAEALIPALNRMGLSPIGAFDLYIGPETPSLYLLIPANSLETLVTAEIRLEHDEEYQRTGHAFLQATAREPAFERAESALLIAFEGQPKLTLPPPTAQHGARVFQLRTYESPSQHAHRVKVEMFHSGEFAVFERAGFWPVFYGDTLIGPRMPNLTYMLSFSDLKDLNAKWKAFGADPEWKKLQNSSKFNYEAIVSNISNLILNPTSYSQI